MVVALALDPLPPLSLQTEHTIRVHRIAAGKAKRRCTDPLAEVEHALRSLRAAGLEAEIWLRGAWRRGCQTPVRVLDLKLEGWTLTPTGLYWDPPIGAVWSPVPAWEPRPVIVVRGVTERSR